MRQMNIVPRIITKNEDTVDLNGCVKFSITNIQNNGDGSKAYVSVDGAVCWILPEQSSMPVNDTEGFEFRQQVKIQFRDSAGQPVETGELSIVRFMPGNEVRVDNTVY